AEWALDRAVGLVGSGPSAFPTWLELTSLDWQTAPLVRLSAVSSASSGAVTGRIDTLFSITPEGLRTEVEAPSGGASRIYLPGRLDLPALLRAGLSWTSQGSVALPDADPSARPAYHADYTSERPADAGLAARACVVVTMTLRVDGQPDEPGRRTWCPSSGIVDYTDAAGAWQPTDTAPPASVAPEAGFDWSSADRLEFTPGTVNQVGAGVPFVSPVAPPGVGADGTLVFANQVVADTLALATTADPPPVAWRARAGGHNTAAATLGGVTVVAGSSRWLVGYGSSGQWLWQQRLGDLAVVAPVRLGDLVVVATLDGAVTGYDLGTGTQRWRHTVAAEVRVPPVVADGRVLVVDQSGRLTCLDGAGAELWTSDVGRIEHFAVSPGDAPAVVLPSSDGPHVQALSLADGSRLWRVREDTTARDVIALDTVVVLRGDAESVALDPATGTRRWTWHDARTYAGTGGGDRVLLLGSDRLVLLDGSGRQVREWPISIGDPATATTYLVAAGRRALVYGPSGFMVGEAR
ncbi:MAG: PQQ-binding-like beta-propeller repeat protein, partial [Propionibacteriaceae bacterium]|nr:PQQ-binding-like beta-propeller repeat protein [Propionibacteriaceae bacterium]